LAPVWLDATAEESSLRFHIASLRKALGDGQSGARYIATWLGGVTALSRRSLGRAIRVRIQKPGNIDVVINWV
jgi:hypothetical protein